MITDQQNSINSDYHLQLIVNCAQGQSILIGSNIAIKINYTYLRKRDKKSCVNLLIEAPVDVPIFQTCVNRHAPKVTKTEDTLESMEDFLNADNDIKQVASSAAQAGTESAHGVNTAQTQYVQGLSDQNAQLQASDAGSASDTVTGKSNRAGKLNSVEMLAPLSCSNGRIVPQDNARSTPMIALQNAVPETLPDVLAEPLQAATKKPRILRKKSPAAHVMTEVQA